MTGEYEGRENLSEETKDLERARQSLIEELEAINWYQERIDATRNEELRRILEHNRDEEKEHVAMLIEWIRKNDSTQDRMFEEHD
ncbi:MAG TPA: ferritin [Candidatus Syntrophoarchaeum butanivorans]|uniref:Ferritin n=1 Tax=Candidatus Syntropharchaeum butanivorans TaxID=1839936 RepID=A0A1F2P5S0_9EURY|nr:MAG: ferritin [Candidatus Syntrophoarchaeum butanivorans]HDM35864.1 ferritin [Candidatus Syntrophoarchaeum butanivorans]HEC57095.1 ferritin [Candidatus Syntrophoarchaeum butanivorans]